MGSNIQSLCSEAAPFLLSNCDAQQNTEVHPLQVTFLLPGPNKYTKQLNVRVHIDFIYAIREKIYKQMDWHVVLMTSALIILIIRC